MVIPIANSCRMESVENMNRFVPAIGTKIKESFLRNKDSLIFKKD